MELNGTVKYRRLLQNTCVYPLLAYPMKIVTKVRRWCIWWVALARVSDCVCLQWRRRYIPPNWSFLPVRTRKIYYPHTSWYLHQPDILSSHMRTQGQRNTSQVYSKGLLNSSLLAYHLPPSLPPRLPTEAIVCTQMILSHASLPQKHSKVGHIFNQTFWYHLQLNWSLQERYEYSQNLMHHDIET